VIKLQPFSAVLLVLAACSGEVPFVDAGEDGGWRDAGPDAGDAGPDAGIDAGLQLPDGGPQFGSPILTSVADGVAGLAAADFNGDGKQDLIVSMGDPNSASGLVGLLIGKGDGTFEPPVLLWTGQSPRGVAVLDIDGDGRPDLAVGVDLSAIFGRAMMAARIKCPAV